MKQNEEKALKVLNVIYCLNYTCSHHTDFHFSQMYVTKFLTKVIAQL